MAINFNPGFNPEEYAKQYATQNNVSIDNARETLRTQYGEPSQNNTSIFGSLTSDTFVSSTNQNYNDIEASFLELENEEGQGIFESIINFFKEFGSGNEMNQLGNQGKQDPDAFAQDYAERNGLPLEDAKAELKEKYGDPQQDGSNFPQINSMPFEIGSQQNPDEYAQIYADENGLTLEEAKAELKEKYGDPKEENNNNFFSNF